MSSWGALDNVLITGTVTTSTTSDSVSGFNSSAFLLEVDAGDYITIDSIKYQVANVVSNTQLYITSVAATTSANVTAFVQQGPKYVSNVDYPANNESIQNIVGVDRVEIAVPENKARGVASHTGWIHYTTYTDAYSQTRNKSEVLVALSKNFSANATGTLFGTGAGTDAVDDTVAADFLVYFTTQPSANAAATGSPATFIAAAATDPAGNEGVLTYRWQISPNTVTWTNLADAGVYSNTTGQILQISDNTGLDGNYYRMNATASSGGADTNTTVSVLLTEV